MSRIFEWSVALLVVVAFGMAGADEFDEQERAAAHKQESIAAARKNSADNKRMADVERRLKDMTAFDRIVAK